MEDGGSVSPTEKLGAPLAASNNINPFRSERSANSVGKSSHEERCEIRSSLCYTGGFFNRTPDASSHPYCLWRFPRTAALAQSAANNSFINAGLQVRSAGFLQARLFWLLPV